MSSSKEELAVQLTSEAYQAIKRSDIKLAKKLGRRILKLRYSSAFEILALAHAADKELDKAIAILEKGVQTAPSSWLLWQLLGNYYSDQQRYEDSLRCYNRALECPHVDSTSIHYNLALVHTRQEKHAEALAILAEIETDSPFFRVQAPALHMQILNSTGRYARTLQVGQRFLEHSATWAKGAAALEDESVQEDLRSSAAVWAHMAVASWKGEGNSKEALAYAWEAIACNKCEAIAMEIIREVRNDVSPRSKGMKLLIEGRCDQRPASRDLKGFTLGTLSWRKRRKKPSR